MDVFPSDSSSAPAKEETVEVVKNISKKRVHFSTVERIVELVDVTRSSSSPSNRGPVLQIQKRNCSYG